MKYINVFDTEASFNDVSNNLSKPQVSYIADNNKIFCLLEGTPGPVPPVPPVGPTSKQIMYTTTDGKIFDISTLMDRLNTAEFSGNATIPLTVVSNTYTDGKGLITFSGDITAIGLDYTNRILYPSFYNYENAYDWTLETVQLPDSIDIIQQYAFRSCENLTEVNIPDAVTSIENGAFESCSSLEEITMGNLVAIIGDGVFANCMGLTTCSIGSAISMISNFAFNNCMNLMSLTVNRVNPPTLGYQALQGVPENCTIYVPAGSTSLYMMASGWEDRRNHIEEIPE